MSMTQDGWLLCGDGGYGSDNVTGRSCLEFSPETGEWRHTGHALRQWRGNHVSWVVLQKVPSEANPKQILGP